MTIGERIKQRRIELGLSQEELAKRLGNKSRASVCTVEKDKEDMTTDRVRKYAKALECSPAYLMGWEEKPTTIKKISDITLSPEEEEIIYAYRKADEVDKNSVRKILNVSIGEKEGVVS